MLINEDQEGSQKTNYDYEFFGGVPKAVDIDSPSLTHADKQH